MFEGATSNMSCYYKLKLYVSDWSCFHPGAWRSGSSDDESRDDCEHD
jgi:hypothetical protein